MSMEPCYGGVFQRRIGGSSAQRCLPSRDNTVHSGDARCRFGTAPVEIEPAQRLCEAKRRVRARAETAQSGASSAPARRSSAPARTSAPPKAAPMAPVYKAPVVPQSAVTFASWVRAYGDYEKRTGTAQTTIDCCTGPVPGGIQTLVDQFHEQVHTGGVLGGFDATWRGVGGTGGRLHCWAAGRLHVDQYQAPQHQHVIEHRQRAERGWYARCAYEWADRWRLSDLFSGRHFRDLTFKVDFLDLDMNFRTCWAFLQMFQSPFPASTAFSPGAGQPA